MERTKGLKKEPTNFALLWTFALISAPSGVYGADLLDKGCQFYMTKMEELFQVNFPRSMYSFQDPAKDGIESFFGTLRQPGDLVFILDRSEGFSAHYFYLLMRPLVEYIIRHHVVMEAHTRIAVLTFAVDVKVHYDAISYDEDPTKCSFFATGGPWEGVLYDRDPYKAPGTFVDLAMDHAYGILVNSNRNVSRTILVITDGSWNSDRNPKIEKVLKLLKNAGLYL